MAQYRNRPIVIEAVQFLPSRVGVSDTAGVSLWPDERGTQPRDMSWGYIDTLEGRMHVWYGDWIITGIEGERYPCKPSIFEATYEPAD